MVISLEHEHNHALKGNFFCITKLKETVHEQPIHSDKMSAHACYV